MIIEYFAGIGRSLAKKLVELGAQVYGVSKTKKNLESLKVAFWLQSVSLLSLVTHDPHVQEECPSCP